MRFHKTLLPLWILVSACSCVSDRSSSGLAQQTAEIARMTAGVSVDRLRIHIEYLASDELEGRAPGSEAEELTLD